jgi:YesN/AraC family two-component response regulator
VVEASNGQEGLRLYQYQPCDLIITDIFMPQEDGIGTIFDLKAQHAPVKIIAISGGGSWMQYDNRFAADDPLEMATRFGANRTLKKPIKLQQLVALVDELLKVKCRLS